MLISRNQKVISYDLTRDDMSKAISDAFKSSKLILVSSTYNMDIFPYMNIFIHGLIERNYQNRIVGFIENGSWMPNATKVMKNLLSNSKNLTYLNSEVRILSSLDERSRKELMLLVRTNFILVANRSFRGGEGTISSAECFMQFASANCRSCA